MIELPKIDRSEVNWEARYNSACLAARAEAARHDITTGLLHESQRRVEDLEDLQGETESKNQTRVRFFLKEIYECESILARALGFPEYQPGEPGYSPNQTNYLTGDHTAVTLAMNVEDKLDELIAEKDLHEKTQSRLSGILGGLHKIIEREREAGNQSLVDELSRLISREE